MRKNLSRGMVLSIMTFLMSINLSKAQELSYYQFSLGTRYYLDGDLISKKKFVSELNSNKFSKQLYKKAKTNKYISYGLLGAQLYTGYAAITNAIEGEQRTSLQYLYANIGIGLVSFYFNDKYNSYKRMAVHEYNNPSKKPKFTMLSSPRNLVGLSFTLDAR